MKQALREYPQECRLLSIQFEEEAYYQLQERDKWRKQGGGGSGEGGEPNTVGDSAGGQWRTEDTVGDDDEDDWFEAEQDM